MAARVLAADGSVLATGPTFYDQPSTPGVPPSEVAATIAGQTVATTPRDGDAHQLVLLVPVHLDDGRVAVLQMTASLAAADTLLGRLRLILLLGSLGAIALGTRLGLPVTRTALRALARMTATSERIAGGASRHAPPILTSARD